MTETEETDPGKRLGKKLMLMADQFTHRLMRFADNIEGYFDDAADAVSPKKFKKEASKDEPES